VSKTPVLTYNGKEKESDPSADLTQRARQGVYNNGFTTRVLDTDPYEDKLHKASKGKISRELLQSPSDKGEGCLRELPFTAHRGETGEKSEGREQKKRNFLTGH